VRELASAACDAGLEYCFFVCRDDELTRTQRASLPNAIIQIEDTPSLGREIWVAWKDPTAMSPRAERIGAEPAHKVAPLISASNPLRDHFAPNLGKRKSRER
jgi:hypothetical protein